MTPRAGFRWALLMWWCSLPLGLPAQDAAPALYDVEIIVFRHRDQSRNTPEISPPAAPDRLRTAPLEGGQSPPPGQSLPPASAAPLTADVLPPPAETRDGPQPGFVLLDPRNLPPPVDLPASRLVLGDLVQRLGRLDAYEPLAHVGWEQAAGGRDVAEAYWLTPVIQGRTGLSGNIKLYRERFLHLALDLQLTEGGPTSPTALRIRESRLLRDDLVQYFDHPGFGVIARVSRHDEPSAPAAAAGP